MAKGSIDRLNETLNQIPVIAAKYPRLFTGIAVARLREILLETLRDDPYFDLNEISEDIALGGTRIIKFASETELRHMKRVTLLFHRVLGYHSSAQTRAYKAQIFDFDQTRMLAELSTQCARGVRLSFYDSLQDWMLKTIQVDGGSLLHYYNQGEDGRLNAMDLTENGWCLGVSTQWVRFKATGRTDFWTWMRTAEGAAALRFVMAGQGVRTGGMGSLSDRAAFALRPFGIIQDEVLTCDTPNVATPQAMAGNITRGPACYCRIGQSYVSGGGHAMAGKNGSPILFMDPNAGEVSFTNAIQLSSWLTKFVRRMRYHFARHYVEHYSYHPERARVDQPRQETLEDTLRNAMAQRRAGLGY